MGLLDGFNLDDPQTMGLLSAAAAMAERSGPSLRPTSLGQILGGGFGAYSQSMAAAKKQRQEDEQARQMAQMRALQMQQLQGQVQDQTDQRGMRTAIQGAARDAYQSPGQQAASLPGGPTNANASMIPSMPGGFNQDQFIQSVMQLDPMQGMALKQQFAKQAPKVKDWKEVQIEGSTLYAPYFEDGTVGKPVPYQVAKALHFQNVGSKTLGLDPMTGKERLSYTNTIDPNSLYSGSVTMRGQNMTDARARDLNAITQEGQQTQVINDPVRGPMLVNKGTGLVRPGIGMNGQPVQGEVGAKREAGAKQILPLLDQIDALIPK